MYPEDSPLLKYLKEINSGLGLSNHVKLLLRGGLFILQ